jgi:hypothetical protein
MLLLLLLLRRLASVAQAIQSSRSRVLFSTVHSNRKASVDLTKSLPHGPQRCCCYDKISLSLTLIIYIPDRLI